MTLTTIRPMDHQKSRKLSTAVSWIVTIAVTLMIVTDIVILRYFFDNPLPASWEISEVCMPAIVFFAFAYHVTIDQHVEDVPGARRQVSPGAQMIFDIATNLISFALCALLTYWSWLRFWTSFASKEEILAADLHSLVAGEIHHAHRHGILYPALRHEIFEQLRYTRTLKKIRWRGTDHGSFH